MFELDPNHPFDIGDPDSQRVFGITAIVYALIIGLIFLISMSEARSGEATDNTVAIMNAMGFTACFVATVVVVGICIITVAVQRAANRDKILDHQARLEQMRLENTKEITVRK